MTAEAKRILDVFHERDVRAGGFVSYPDFGDAIPWENGGWRPGAVRDALITLLDDGLVIELNAGLQLTERGEAHLKGSQQPKHGARVYKMGRKVLVKQTVLRGTPPEYVIDEHRERHVEDDDDAGIAAAVRDAVNGRL